MNLKKSLSSLLAKLPVPVAGALKAVTAAVVPLLGQVILDGTLNYKGIATAAVSALAVYFTTNFKTSHYAPVSAGHPDPTPASPTAPSAPSAPKS